uniref:MADF domain-containing protein n=1 Tax=Heterorhabditis bacteriophora TaxID=37862 RepID=A0A1I7W8V7_HETBA
MFGDDPEMKKRWDHVNEHQLKVGYNVKRIKHYTIISYL